MPWREAFLENLGTGLLGGITWGQWLRLLRENSFAISPGSLFRALAITLCSPLSSWTWWREERRYGAEWRATAIEPPIFVLGHWRSGTTHLHNLLTVDDRFAFPNGYQVMFPRTFLMTEAVSAPLMQFFLPPRRPMDNMEWSVRSPQEDEFAYAIACGKSQVLGWTFPRNREHYDRFLTFREATAAELAEWRAAIVEFLQKVTWKHRKPLVLKSPQHTCRIQLLLELFPQARFVHIHRHPYAVFSSWRNTLRSLSKLHLLQRPRFDDLDDHILQQYRTMYDVFFEERALIPAGQYHEIGFEQLEIDPVGELRSLYAALNLPDFAVVEPAVQQYVDSLAGYRKNAFPELPVELRDRIATAWRPCFDAWGYAV